MQYYQKVKAVCKIVNVFVNVFRSRRWKAAFCCFGDTEVDQGRGTSGTTTNEYSATYHAGDTDDHNYEELKGVQDHVYNEIEPMITEKPKPEVVRREKHYRRDPASSTGSSGGLKQPVCMQRSYSNPKDMLIAGLTRSENTNGNTDCSYTYPYDKVYRRESCSTEADDKEEKTLIEKSVSNCTIDAQETHDVVNAGSEKDIDKDDDQLGKDSDAETVLLKQDTKILDSNSEDEISAEYFILEKEKAVDSRSELDEKGGMSDADTDTNMSVEVELRPKPDQDTESIENMVVRKSRDSNFSSETSFIDELDSHQRNSAS